MWSKQTRKGVKQMPNSCKCILDRMVHKGAMTEEERDKILRNIKTDWIPVTERLPDADGRYIVTIKGVNSKWVQFSYYENDEWAVESVTAWMDLKPYEGSDSDGTD